MAAIQTSPRPETAPAAGGSVPRVWPYFASDASLVSRRAFDAVGGFDECLDGGFGEDYELGIRLRLRGFKLRLGAARGNLPISPPSGRMTAEGAS